MRIAGFFLVAVLSVSCGGSSEDDGNGGSGGTGASGGSAGASGSSGGGGSGASGGSSGASGSGGADACGLPADPGPCEGALRRWFFNAATGKCEQFIYGGCEGNANNFERPGECASVCAPDAEHPCLAISCNNATCLYASPTSGPACVAPCDAATGSCPQGFTCTCGSSCPTCKDCAQACFPQG
jgi:hypothetical protein